MAGRPHPHRVASTRSLFKLSILSASLLLGAQGVMAADCTDLGNINGECTITDEIADLIHVTENGNANTAGDLTLSSTVDKQVHLIKDGALTVNGALTAESLSEDTTEAAAAIYLEDSSKLTVMGNATIKRSDGEGGAAMNMDGGTANFMGKLDASVGGRNEEGDAVRVQGGALNVAKKLTINVDEHGKAGLRVYDLNGINNDAVINLNGGIDINSLANGPGIAVHGRTANIQTEINIAGDSDINMTNANGGTGIQLKVGTLNLAAGSNTTISTQGTKALGMDLSGSAVVIDGQGQLNLNTKGNEAIALLIADNAQAALQHVSATTGGDAAHGIASNDGGRITINSGDIQTTGAGAAGLRAEGDDMNTSLITANNMVINTQGADAYGAHGASGSKIVLTDSEVKAVANALVNDSINAKANMILTNTTVTSTGGSALVSTADNGYRATTALNNVVLSSPTQAAISLSGAKHTVQLSEGSQAINHNGTWLQADGDSISKIILDASAVSGMATTAAGSTTDLTLNNGSQWLDAGQSTVSKLTNNGSLVSLQNGKAGDVLAVTGDYIAGSGAKLALDVTLNGDGSASDKLVIGGNTEGITTVAINNTGGTGVKVVNGIEVISVGGQSNGVFEQDGRIVAGAYDYYLGKGDGVATEADNWYLTNKLTPVPPVDPGKPAPGPSIRPEAGAYLGNYLAANTMFNMRLYDRLGELGHRDEGNIGMWTRLVGGQTRFTDGSGALSAKSDRSLVQIGTDVLQWELDKDSRIHLGAMAGYAYNDLSVRTNSPDAQASQFKTHSTGKLNGYSFGVYGTYYGDKKDQTGLYVDSWLLFNHFDAKMRGSDKVGEEQYVLRGWTASAETGYAFKLGQRAETGYYIQPQAQLTWMGVSSGDVREKNGTLIKHKDDDNIQTRVGVRLYAKADHEPQSTGYKAFVEANWLHNTSDYKISMDDVNDHIRGVSDLAEVKLGLEGKISKTGSWWANLGYQTGKNDFRDTTVNLGMKKYF